MHHDAILIGAGMSGLAAALRLALFGKDVVVLERHNLWGGLNSFYTKDGHAFDVGLHALTNFVPAGTRGAALTKVLRQLRIRHAELKLGQQRHSELRVPGARLRFSNELDLLTSEIEREFPGQVDGFRRLVSLVESTSLDEEPRAETSGRAVLEDCIGDRRLVDALLLPLFYYGSAREDDVDWTQLTVLFRAIFLEGLSRPEGGIRPLINLLVKRCKRAGADLRLSAGVARILTKDGRARGVELESGEVLTADTILSSAGFVETMELCGEEVAAAHTGPADHGRLSFLEVISVLDTPPAELGFGAATCFYSTREPFRYRRPEGTIDPFSGVLSAPTNFEADRPPAEPLLRATVLANPAPWLAFGEDEYRAAKDEACERALAEVDTLLGPWQSHTTYRDSFTPRTVQRFTGHRAGAIYGSPRKRKDGRTPIDALVLMGTDQGYLGVVGAMMSGIAMANRHVIAPAASSPSSTVEVRA